MYVIDNPHLFCSRIKADLRMKLVCPCLKPKSFMVPLEIASSQSSWNSLCPPGQPPSFVYGCVITPPVGILSMSFFWIMVLEKTLESPLDIKEIKLVNPKGNQAWIFFGRTDAEAPILWLPDVKNPNAGKDWGQDKKEETEDEMVGWHHWFNGHEFEQTPGDSEGQGSLACWDPWGLKD